MTVPKLTLSAIFSLLLITAVPAQKRASKNYDDHNTWAAGIGTGILYVVGDVPASKFTLHQTIEVRKNFASWFTARFNYTHGNAKGIHWLASENFAKNTAWSPRYAAPVRMPNGSIQNGFNNNGVFTPAASADRVYYNYKTSITALSLSAQFTLPLPFTQPRFGLSVMLGTGAMFYNAKVNTLNSDGDTYKRLFNQITTATHSNKKQVLDALKAGMDNSYETAAEDYSKQPHFTKHLGFAASYRFKQNFEVALEKSFTFIKSDLVDGQRWQEHAYGDAVLTRDWDFVVLNTLSLRYYFR